MGESPPLGTAVSRWPRRSGAGEACRRPVAQGKARRPVPSNDRALLSPHVNSKPTVKLSRDFV